MRWNHSITDFSFSPCSTIPPTLHALFILIQFFLFRLWYSLSVNQIRSACMVSIAHNMYVISICCWSTVSSFIILLIKTACCVLNFLSIIPVSLTCRSLHIYLVYSFALHLTQHCATSYGSEPYSVFWTELQLLHHFTILELSREIRHNYPGIYRNSRSSRNLSL